MGASFCLRRRLGSSIPRGVWSPVGSEGKPTVCAGGNGAGDVYSKASLGRRTGHKTVQLSCWGPLNATAFLSLLPCLPPGLACRR